ncbi:MULTISPECIES: GH-E family nuclease [unclassified Undibacterium]|uniref:GH-E family nuclease n=1 Tax=unclassified Undibacterium TaxID=2630295 RepID=UPI003394D4D8
MSHKTDAVTWWNETGRQFGAKSSEVRAWMLDSKNYVLDHLSINRSLGAKLGETYLPPLK